MSFVQSGIRQMPQRYAVRVRIDAPPERVAAAIGRWGTVEPSHEGCVLLMNEDSLGWPLTVLAELDADFEVESPPDLRDAVARIGARFSTATS